jgi:2-octaprenyl-6-methoxyphenol hydroxylase
VQSFDAIVAGAGPSGLVSAALLARDGWATALVGEEANSSDPRTIALMQPSIRLLCHLGVWPGELAVQGEPLRSLRIVDDTGEALSAPTLTFSAGELDLDAFGWNVPVAALTRALAEVCSSGVARFMGRLETLVVETGGIRVTCSEGQTLAAPVIVGADGRNSFVRRTLEIATEEWSYDQAALATTFQHSQRHDGLSLEYHRPHGPFTTVPLPGHRSGIVWMERPQRIAELAALEEGEFAAELQAALHGQLGLISDLGTRTVFAIDGLLATQFGGPRTLLVGEAAHCVPPIGAQGLNMSLRDAAMAAELLGDARRAGLDPGGVEVLRHYGEVRRRDVMPRQHIIHAVNRSLLGRSLPFSAFRSLGLTLLDGIAPLRRLVMSEGLEPSHLPLAMREPITHEK